MSHSFKKGDKSSMTMMEFPSRSGLRKLQTKNVLGFWWEMMKFVLQRFSTTVGADGNSGLTGRITCISKIFMFRLPRRLDRVYKNYYFKFIVSTNRINTCIKAYDTKVRGFCRATKKKE